MKNWREVPYDNISGNQDDPTPRNTVKSEFSNNQSNFQANSRNGSELGSIKRSTYDLINLSRLYADEYKYSGEGDSFDFKYGIFIDLCEKAEVPKELYFKAFSKMLKGTALNHFYTSIKTDPCITQLFEICENMRQTFEGEDFKRTMLTKWNNTTLQTVLSKNPGKDIETCLQILIEELRATQMTLKKNL